MGVPYCSSCGSFHIQTTAGCPGQWTNVMGGERTGAPGVSVDTGAIHRAPLIARIERLERLVELLWHNLKRAMDGRAVHHLDDLQAEVDDALATAALAGAGAGVD